MYVVFSLVFVLLLMFLLGNIGNMRHDRKFKWTMDSNKYDDPGVYQMICIICIIVVVLMVPVAAWQHGTEFFTNTWHAYTLNPEGWGENEESEAQEEAENINIDWQDPAYEDNNTMIQLHADVMRAEADLKEAMAYAKAAAKKIAEIGKEE